MSLHSSILFVILAGSDAFSTFQINSSRGVYPFVSSARPTDTGDVAVVKNSSSKTKPPNNPQWQVYVDQSKTSIDKGGAATLDAFICLAPPDQVKIHPAIFSSIPSKAKGPLVRCISLSGENQQDCHSFDVSNVDSVDKVARILRKHMKIAVGSTESLEWKYQGTSHLERGNTKLAIECYDRAIETSDDGVLFLLRAAAYLERAASHRRLLRECVQKLNDDVDLNALQEAVVASRNIHLAHLTFERIVRVTELQERQFRQTQYRHGLYQFSLLQAAQDAFRATQMLPSSAEAWRRAADILSELWKLKEAEQYYERARELDRSVDVTANIQQIYKRQQLLESARAYGWSEDTLRLALDVAR